MTDFVIAGPRHALPPQLSLLRRIYLPRTADAGAFAMSTYGIPLIVLATTQSATLTGIAFALEWLPRLAAFSLAGQVVDRHGTKRVFRIASVLRALVVVAAAFILPTQAGGTGATITVMALAAITGVVTEFSYIAAETAGATASKDAGDRAHRVQSVLLGIDQTATLAGPAFAGFLLHAVGVTGTLLTMAACSLLGALLAPWHRESRLVPPPAPALAGLRTGWKTLVSIPALAWLITGLTVSNMATGVLQAAAPVIVVQHLGQSSAAVGLIWSAAAAASLLAVALCRFAIDLLGGGFKSMVEFTAPVFWLFFLLTGISLFVLRRREPNVPRPFKVPLYPVLPLLFCASCAYMLWSSLSYVYSQQLGGLNAAWIGVAVLAIGVVLLLLLRSKSDR